MSNDLPESNKRRTVILFAVAVLIGALILLIAVEWGSIVGSKPAPFAEPEKTGAVFAPEKSVMADAESGPTAARAFASTLAAPPDPVAELSPVADTLNDPAQDIRGDLGIVAELFAFYLAEFRELPVGNNAEITAALAGDNPRAYAVLPPHHRAINSAGELTDRWATPFFFHQWGGGEMEIRSSGPDRRRYTADDAVWPEVSASPADDATTVAVR